MITHSSTTRLVEASSNAIAAVKLAPFRKRERAMATAAYEQDDEAAPRPHAMASVLGRSSPSNFAISLVETTAWIAAEMAKPRINAQRISQNMANAMRREWASSHADIRHELKLGCPAETSKR